MCGIFAYTGKNNASEIIFAALQNLEYRGYDSWGIALNMKKKYFIRKKVGKIGNEKINDLPASNLGLGHTRWATHGKVNIKNTHPQADCVRKILVVHNGIVENYEQLKRNLIKKGHKFISDTDTEVICHLIEDYNKSYLFPNSVRKAFLKLDGLNAFIASQLDSHKIIAVRKGSPLVIGFGNKENYISSDISALIPYTKSVYYLNDNEISIVSKNQVVIKKAHTYKPQIIKKKKINIKAHQVSKNSYPHYMLKEIYEQPKLISNIRSVNQKYINNLFSRIRKAENTYLIGCGSSLNACLAGFYLFSQISKKKVNWVVASEFNNYLAFLNKKCLVIALSQSGETIDIIEAIRNAKKKKANILALVNVLESSLAREADYKIPLMAGPEKAVATTKAFTIKLSYLLLLSYALKRDIKAGKLQLNNAIKAIKKIFHTKSLIRIKRLAQDIKDYKSIYVIGKGISYAVALETALKIKEISYIHAEGFASGELKHGVIALIEKGTPCIVFFPNDKSFGENLAAAMEMKARGGKIIGISHKKHEILDYFIPIDDCQEATIIPNAVFGQLLAYYLAIVKGYDPDKPRNLAKSVTVK